MRAAPFRVIGGANMRFWLFPALLAPVLIAHPATPARYDLSATIARVPLAGGPSLGTKFFFAKSNQAVYRLLPAGGKEADPAASWQYWSARTGPADILPVAGYASLEIKALNAAGAAIGQTAIETPAHREAALYWTPGGGPRTPAGFDAGYSGLEAVNGAGQAAGFSDSGTYELLAWNAAYPAAGPTRIPVPAGYTSPQIGGLSARGKVLLYLRSRDGLGRAAIWDGRATSVIGPAPAETFYPSNCAINAAGDVAVLVFTAGGDAVLHYVFASDPTQWLTFTFPGPVDSNVYNLRISDAGVASFDTSINGLNTVAVASSVARQQYTFTGYRSYLNNAGALVFGDGGLVKFWDAAAWTGAPSTVPVSAASDSGGMDLVGFNDDGYLLVLSSLAETRSLDVLQPVFTQPLRVTIRPAAKVLRLPAGRRGQVPTVIATVDGDPLDPSIRYRARGKVPAGLRFRPGDAVLSGTPKKAQAATLRVTATYRSQGARQQSDTAKVNVVVRAH